MLLFISVMSRKKIYFSSNHTNNRDFDSNTVIIKKKSNPRTEKPNRVHKKISKKNLDLINNSNLIKKKKFRSTKRIKSSKRIRSSKRITSAKKNFINIGKNMMDDKNSHKNTTINKFINKPKIVNKPKSVNKPTIINKNKSINTSTINNKPKIVNKPKSVNKPKIANKPKSINTPTIVNKPKSINKPTIINKHKSVNKKQNNLTSIRYYEQKPIDKNIDIDLVSVSILKNKLNFDNELVSENAPKKLIKDLFLMLNDNSIRIKHT